MRGAKFAHFLVCRLSENYLAVYEYVFPISRNYGPLRLNSVFKAALPLLSLATIPAFATPTYLGLYMRNQKIGYASYKTYKISLHGRRLERSDTHTVMDTGMLGTPLRIEIDSQSYVKVDGQPVEMDFQMKSQGRTQLVNASFLPKTVRVHVNNSGSRSDKVLKRPSGPIVDDPINLVLAHKGSGKCFILDPTTVSFVENQIRISGTRQEKIGGRTVTETVIDVVDPRATTRAYLDAKGNLIRADGAMGISMVPESEAVALAKPGKYSPSVDLAYSSCIVPTGKMINPGGATELKLQISGKDLSAIPTDESQTVVGKGNNWTFDIHPPRLSKGVSIAQSAAEKGAWTKPDTNIPSDSTKFIKLAKKIVGKKTQAVSAALAIKDWVYSVMKPNASIGVLRDASEVLTTKEGVCRDYAILTATLLRSAGIPTRLASGLVSWDGTFYYHAWDEIWDGKHWIGIDSTTPDSQISAAHVKLAQGSVADAFTFAVLDHVKVQVLSSQE